MTKLPNKFLEIWHPELFGVKPDWHENKIGVYHISAVGVNHQDLGYDEHSGPCLRNLYREYTDPIPDSPSTMGNFEMGEDLHRALQKIVKEWEPNTIIEKPLAKIFTRDERSILLVGSIDIEYFQMFNLKKATSETKRKVEIWDIKSASSYTLPRGRYDKNPTHFDQTKVYGGFDILFGLNTEHCEMVRVKIIYIDKHNKATYIQREKFIPEEAIEMVGDCVDRAFYLDSCLLNKQIPVPEPMKWCKYCKYLDWCIGQNDVEPIYKRKNIIGLEVI